MTTFFKKPQAVFVVYNCEIASKASKTNITLKWIRALITVWLNPWAGKVKWILHSVNRLPKRASHLRDFLCCSCKKKFSFRPYNKSSIDQLLACSVWWLNIGLILLCIFHGNCFSRRNWKQCLCKFLKEQQKAYCIHA